MMNLQQAQRLLEFIDRLEAIPEADRRPGEADALKKAYEHRQEAKSVIGSYGATYRGAAQGVTLRGGDELMAGIQSPFSDLTYEEILAEERRRNEAARRADPEAYASGETAGMLGTGAAAFAIPSLTATRGLGLLGQILLGGAEGAALAAAPDFLGGEGGFLNRVKEVSPFASVAGAGLGAIAPVAGQIAGAAARGVQNLRRAGGVLPEYGGRAATVAARGVGRTARTGEDIEAYLSNLGPEAMLADVPGGPQSQAMGLAAQQGEGGTIVSRALTSRAEQATPRIEATTTAVAGDPTAAFYERMRIAAEKRGLGPTYEAALSYRDPIDVSGIVTGIDSMLVDATGETANKLKYFKEFLQTDDGTVSAVRLHNTRVSINDEIGKAYREGRNGLARQLDNLLKVVDDRLDKLPGYLEAKTGWANVSEMERQVEAGRGALIGGRVSVMTPQELAATFSRLSDAQKEAFRTGVREDIANLMGTARNAPATAWGELMKGYNDAKLKIIFGSDEAGQILQRLEAEKVFSETRGRVTQGSMTEMRRQAEADLGAVREPDTGRRPGPVKQVVQWTNDQLNSAIDAVLFGPRRSTANQELGKILSLQGAERDRAVSALLREALKQQENTRAQAVVELLARIGFGSMTPTLSNEAPR